MKRENKTKYAILGMLSFKPMSGYEIGQRIQNSTKFFWAESDGQLYPILKKMTQDGLVTISAGKSGKRNKKIYAISLKGEQDLMEWLLSTPTTFTIRNEFLLQLFFGHNLKKEINLEKIREFQNILKQQLAVYTQLEKSIKEKSEHPTYLLITLSYGQHVIKSEIAWCDEVIETLGDRK